MAKPYHEMSHQERWQCRQVEKGLCRKCCNRPETGRTLCSDCREYNRNWERANRAKRKLQRIRNALKKADGGNGGSENGKNL